MEQSNQFYFEENDAEFRIEAWSHDRQIVAEGYQKVKGGVRHLVQRYDAFDVKQFKEDIQNYGHLSSRPYLLGQGCDGSINNPVMALYYRYCKRNGINPDQLLAQAYPEERNQKTNWKYILQDAKWQGMKYPKKWGAKEYEGLLESLTQINYHSLNTQLSEMKMGIRESESSNQANVSRHEELKQVREQKDVTDNEKEFQR